MKATIDQEKCIGCGACAEACPEIFKMEGGEPASIVKEHQTNGPFEGEIPDELVGCARDAADICPIEAISVTEKILDPGATVPEFLGGIR